MGPEEEEEGGRETEGRCMYHKLCKNLVLRNTVKRPKRGLPNITWKASELLIPPATQSLQTEFVQFLTFGVDDPDDSKFLFCDAHGQFEVGEGSVGIAVVVVEEFGSVAVYDGAERKSVFP